MKKTKSILSVATFVAISFTFFACSDSGNFSGGGSYLGDDSSSSGGNGGSGDSSSSGGSSSSSGGNGGSGDSSSSSVGNCDDYSGGDGSFSCGGQTYKTVEIGDQTWMAENLNYDADGSKCYGEDGWLKNSETGLFTLLEDEIEIQANCDKYGRLYNWETAMTVCPNGWHLPTDEDWNKLFRYVVSVVSGNVLNYDQTAGRYLKATSGWNDYNDASGNGEDTYGFAALPGGYGTGGNFYNVGNGGCWWRVFEGNTDT